LSLIIGVDGAPLRGRPSPFVIDYWEGWGAHGVAPYRFTRAGRITHVTWVA
jgi:hypothetical protein